ncbi:MAG TPA: glutamine-hydrolyzing carbamoyl-phosphate synthase small subunit [Limnochordia bacterium]
MGASDRAKGEARGRARLVLEDGSVFSGVGIGALCTPDGPEVTGEVVFNTSMTGYQEILTDPSYRGEIVAMTYPLIGNYGVNGQDVESARPHARGFVVREMCRTPSHWRAVDEVQGFLESHRIPGIAGVDTRALTRRLRERGTMKGILTADVETPAAVLAERARNAPDLSMQDLVREASTDRPYVFADGAGGPHISVVDFGSKRNILRVLAERGCRITVFPAASSAEEILAARPDGIVLSNGPGDPRAAAYALDTIRVLATQVPLFGICLGHQLLALAWGGETFKLRYGHRGANHPVQETQTGRVYITAQNHGFAVHDDGWEQRDVIVSHRNLNDGTIEGLRHRYLPVQSVQYHPEASPGPRDSLHLFDSFVAMLRQRAMSG